MPLLGGFDPALATLLLLALNGLVPLPRAAVCIPAGAALGWAAVWPSMVGTAIGFGLAFGLARFVVRGPVERLARRRPRVAAVMRAVDAEGWRVLALVRLGSPIPGPLINLGCGVSRLGFGAFMLVSVSAVLPQTLLFVYLGHAGRQALARGATSGLDMAMVLAGIALTLVALRRIWTAAQRQSARMLADTGVPAA